MTPYELLDALSGEILLNRAYCVVDGQSVVIAAFVDNVLTFTAAGAELAAKHGEAAPAQTTKARRARLVPDLSNTASE